MPDSELNFIIKLRHITTYLESGVTAVRVEVSKFLTFSNTQFFFKLKKHQHNLFGKKRPLGIFATVY